jgi:hypothetical protein
LLGAQRVDDGEMQHAVEVRWVRSVKDPLGQCGGLGDLSGAQQSRGQLRSRGVGLSAAGGQQLNGAPQQVHGNRWRAGRRLSRGLSKQAHGFQIPVFSAQQQVARNPRKVGPGAGKRAGNVTVQRLAYGRGDVLIDRLLHELVPEGDATTLLIQQLPAERLGEISDDGRLITPRHDSEVSNGHRITKDGAELEDLERTSGEIVHPTQHQIAHRARQLVTHGLDAVAVPRQPSLCDQRSQQFHDEQRIAGRPLHDGGEQYAGSCTKLLPYQRVHLSATKGRQAAEVGSHSAAGFPQHVERCRPRRGTARQYHQQRNVCEPMRDRRGRGQGRIVGPVQVLEHQENRCLGTQHLEQIGHLLDDLEPRVTAALVQEEAADGRPSHVRRPGSEFESIDDRAERPVPLERMRGSPHRRDAHSGRDSGVAVDESGLPDSCFALDNDNAGSAAA